MRKLLTTLALAFVSTAFAQTYNHVGSHRITGDSTVVGDMSLGGGITSLDGVGSIQANSSTLEVYASYDLLRLTTGTGYGFLIDGDSSYDLIFENIVALDLDGATIGSDHTFGTGDIVTFDAYQIKLVDADGSSDVLAESFYGQHKLWNGNIVYYASGDKVTFNAKTVFTDRTGFPMRIGMQLSPEDATLSSGTGTKYSFYVPEGIMVSEIYTSSTTYPTVAMVFDIYIDGGDTINASSITLPTSGNHYVSTTSFYEPSVTKNALITVEVTTAPTAGAHGCKVWLIGTTQ